MTYEQYLRPGNGICFDELQVTKFGSTHYPVRYNTVISFQCYNPGVRGKQTFWAGTIYFNKPNGHYLWKMGKRSDGFVIASKKITKICPATFKQDTWYFINFFDQRYEAFLYVDKAMGFHVYKKDRPVNF